MGLTICLKNKCGKHPSFLAAAGSLREIVVLQRTLPGWVPNTTVYDSLRHARAYPKTGFFPFQHVRNKKIERAKNCLLYTSDAADE